MEGKRLTNKPNEYNHKFDSVANIIIIIEYSALTVVVAVFIVRFNHGCTLPTLPTSNGACLQFTVFFLLSLPLLLLLLQFDFVALCKRLMTSFEHNSSECICISMTITSTTNKTYEITENLPLARSSSCPLFLF